MRKKLCNSIFYTTKKNSIKCWKSNTIPPEKKLQFSIHRTCVFLCSKIAFVMSCDCRWITVHILKQNSNKLRSDNCALSLSAANWQQNRNRAHCKDTCIWDQFTVFYLRNISQLRNDRRKHLRCRSERDRKRRQNVKD